MVNKVIQLSSVHHIKDTRIFYKISMSLIKAGYNVDLIIQNEKDDCIEGLNIKALPIANRKIDRLLLMPRIIRKLIFYKRGSIIHFHDPELIPIGLIFKILGYKIIYDVHEDVPKTILEKDWIWRPIRKIIALIAKNFEQLGNSIFDSTIVVTQAIGEKFNNNCNLIQNFPVNGNEDLKKPDFTSRSDIFYVGSISKVRGITEILEAIEIINAHLPIRLKLAGTFSSNYIEDEVKSHKAWENVQFFGRINRSQLQKIAETSILGLVIFHPIPNHIEAQPNKLFEYMQYGLPVVGSNFDLWKEIIEENNCGILVDPLNPIEIAEAILWIYKNPEKAQIMGENGRRAVIEKYNWQVEEQKLLEIYTSMIDS